MFSSYWASLGGFMRALPLVLFLLACGNPVNPSPDIAMQVNDLAVTTNDLATAKTGCADFRDCLNMCQDASCVTLCGKNATAKAKTLQTAYATCAFTDCNMPKDGGTVRCADANDTSADCNLCFMNSLHGGSTGIACAPV